MENHDCRPFGLIGSRLFQLITAFVISFGPMAGAHEKTPDLRLATATLPPVTTPEGDGYLDRIYNEMFARAGLSYEKFQLPIARGMTAAESGLIDGDMARTAMSESRHPDLLRMPEPVINVEFAGLSIRPYANLNTWEDFAPLRLGFVRGWKLPEELFKTHPDVQRARNADILMTMLVNDRIDIAFLTVVPARYKARSLNIDHLYVSDVRKKSYLYLYLNAHHAMWMDRLEQALRDMKEDGTYAQITKDYVEDGL